MKRMLLLQTIIIALLLGAAVSVQSVMLPPLAAGPHYTIFDGFVHHFRATDPLTGDPVADGIHSISLSVWSDSTGGTQLWTEASTVETKDGLGQLQYGLTNPIPLDVLGIEGDTDRVLYNEITFDGEVLSPRHRLGAVPFANISSRVLGDIETGEGRISVVPQTAGTYEFELIVEDNSGLMNLRNIGSSGQDGVSIKVNDSTSEVEMVFKAFGSDAIKGQCSGTISIFDPMVITERIDRAYSNPDTQEGYGITSRAHSDSGASLRVSNIGSSGEDGVSIDVDATTSRLTVSSIGSSGQEGVSLRVDDTSSTLNLLPPTAGDFVFTGFVTHHEGRTILTNSGPTGEDGVSLSVDSGGGRLLVSNIDSSGMDGVSIAAGFPGGTGEGGGISLVRQPAGQSVPIELVSLSLVSAEPIITIRSENSAPSEPPALEWDFDFSDQVIQKMRSGPAHQGDSCMFSSSGLELYDFPMEYFYDVEGTLYRDGSLAQTNYQVTSAGDLTVRGRCDLALGAGNNVGVGVVSPPFKLFVDGDICATGSIGPCSDARFKKNVKAIESALEIVKKIEGVKFDWRTDEFPDYKFGEDRQVGFIAQDIIEVLPEIVTRGSDGYYSVDYSRLTPVLVEAMKEQQKKLESLEAEVAKTNKLEKEIAELKELVLQLAGACGQVTDQKLALNDDGK